MSEVLPRPGLVVRPLPPGPTEGRSKRLRRRILWGVVALVVLWLVCSAVVVVLGLLAAGRGMTAVGQAKRELSASALVAGSPLSPLRSAEGDFRSSESLLNSPVVAPFEVLPVLGRQLRSLQSLSSAARRTTEIGVGAMQEVRSVLDMPHQAGPDRVTTLRQLARLAGSTETQLNGIDTGPSEALFSPIAAKRADFVHELDLVRTRLEHATAVASVTADILQGPQSYLVLMANPAEMRSGSGAFLEAGLLSADDGQLHLSQLTPVTELTLAPGTVPVGGDLEARWGWLLPGVDWRNLGLTPQFNVNAQLAARMWLAATGEHVQGVVAVDVQALRQILSVTGPVTLSDGTVIGAGDVVQFLTHDQYIGLSDSTATSGASALAAAARQDELGAIAHGALSALDSESLDLKALANAMTSSTEGRHMLLWSASASTERAWSEAGVGGLLGPSSLVAAVINRGGNKLDQYLGVQASLQVHEVSRDRSDLTLTVRLENHTPPGQSQFIAGPYPGLGTTYGQYVGLLALNLPSEAFHIEVQGDPPLSAYGPEGPTWLVASPVDVLAGGTQQIVVHFRWPSEHGSINVVPSARLDPVPWTYPGGHATDAAPFVISW